jgi:hypothetical protein
MVDEKVTVAVGSATTGAGVRLNSAQEVRAIITKIKKSESIYLFMENSFKNEMFSNYRPLTTDYWLLTISYRIIEGYPAGL